ncbi:MAG: hypothetical protein HQK88_13090 [Nitrospirae bacterium]|nr:hypothetical protein [Nitrospirota bacterium]MBF0535931.1 hypothetical protein [Nitrospirota bacterium]MBF0617737.1 hypothetical protein [Nitrospirota bacterium]
MAVTIKRFISKVLPDGHLSPPADTAWEVGNVFEVILIPVEEKEIYAYAEGLTQEKGFNSLTESDIENIIHESRGIY